MVRLKMYIKIIICVLRTFNCLCLFCFIVSLSFLSVLSSRFCRLSTRALGQNGRCRQTFSIIRSSLSLHSFSSLPSLRCLPVRTPSLDPSLSFLSRSPTSNCSLICCDRSSCHHLPTGHQRPRTFLRVDIHCRQFTYNPREGTPFVLSPILQLCCPLGILFWSFATSCSPSFLSHCHRQYCHQHQQQCSSCAFSFLLACPHLGYCTCCSCCCVALFNQQSVKLSR